MGIIIVIAILILAGIIYLVFACLFCAVDDFVSAPRDIADALEERNEIERLDRELDRMDRHGKNTHVNIDARQIHFHKHE